MKSIQFALEDAEYARYEKVVGRNDTHKKIYLEAIKAREDKQEELELPLAEPERSEHA